MALREIKVALENYCKAWLCQFSGKIVSILPREIRDMVYGYMTFPETWTVTPGLLKFVVDLDEPPIAFEPALQFPQPGEAPYYLLANCLDRVFASEMAEEFLQRVQFRVETAVDLADFISKPFLLTNTVPRDFIRRLEFHVSLPSCKDQC
jgi:hypothetical protein